MLIKSSILFFLFYNFFVNKFRDNFLYIKIITDRRLFYAKRITSSLGKNAQYH